MSASPRAPRLDGSTPPVEAATSIPYDPWPDPVSNADQMQRESRRRIAELARRTWTDHNIHDPGITTLDVLAYALSDLAWRAGLPVADLVSRPSDFDEKGDFFTAREAFTCSPVTLDDHRQLVLDVPGVQDVRFSMAPVGGELPLMIDPQAGRLSALPPKQVPGGCPLPLDGIVDMELELELDPVLGDLNSAEVPIRIAGQQVLARLLARRSGDRDWQMLDLMDWSSEGDEHRLHKALEELRGRPGGLAIEGLALQADPQDADLLLLDLSLGPLDLRVRLESSALNHAVSGDIEAISAALRTASRALASELLLRTWHKLRLRQQVLQEVSAQVHAHRPLCQDLGAVRCLALEQIGLCLDVELDSRADSTGVLARILLAVEGYLSPPNRFYELDEALAGGGGRPARASDQVFGGPRNLHGFLDPVELAANQRRTVVYGSDLISLIHDIDGVVAVRRLLMSSWLDETGAPRLDGERWELVLSQDRMRVPRLRLSKSKIVFFRGPIPQLAARERARAQLEELRAAVRRPRLMGEERDLPVPAGRSARWSKVSSVQRHFALTYGIGPEGPPPGSDPRRRAQVRQLKGWLMFFDQLLADHGAQLAAARELLSVRARPDHGSFSRPAFDGPDLGPILRRFMERHPGLPASEIRAGSPTMEGRAAWADWATWSKEEGNEYARAAQALLEDEATRTERRDRGLDHLLARHGERFDDYGALMRAMDQEGGAAAVVEDKADFLAGAMELGYRRGTGYDQLRPEEVADGTNRSGFEARVGLHLGIPERAWDLSVHWLDLSSAAVGDEVRWRYRLLKPGRSTPILESPPGSRTRPELGDLLLAFRQHGARPDRWQISAEADGTLTLRLLDADGRLLGQGPTAFKKPEGLEKLRDEAIAWLQRPEGAEEGLHVVEHLLLRPVDPGCDLLPIHLHECHGGEGDCEDPPPEVEPYSHRATVILPGWPRRFASTAFRRHAEWRIRSEAPAHVSLRICWVDQPSMFRFEEAWRSFILVRPTRRTQPDQYRAALNAVIGALIGLRTVQPEARLADCTGAEGAEAVVLDHSALGVFKDTYGGHP